MNASFPTRSGVHGNVCAHSCRSMRRTALAVQMATVRVIVLLMLLTATCFVLSCRPSTPPVAFFTYEESEQRKVTSYDLPRQVAALTERNPVADAEKAWKKGDKRPFSVRGYVTTIPGLPKAMEDQEIAMVMKSKIIRGTSDYQRTPLEVQLNTAADSYAERYNKRLFELSSRENDNKTVKP